MVSLLFLGGMQQLPSLGNSPSPRQVGVVESCRASLVPQNSHQCPGSQPVGGPGFARRQPSLLPAGVRGCPALEHPPLVLLLLLPDRVWSSISRNPFPISSHPGGRLRINEQLSDTLTFYPSPGDAQTGEALGLLTSLWVIRKLGQCPLVEVVDCAFAHEDFLYRTFIFQTLSSLRLECLKRDYDGYPLGPGCWEKVIISPGPVAGEASKELGRARRMAEHS